MNDTLVEARHLRREFGIGHAKVVAVDDVSLSVRAGEVVLILGPSGSGKTTLLAMLGCILTPTGGELAIDGRAVAGLAPSSLSTLRRRMIGFVFQSFNLLKALTARENVEVALNLNGIRGGEARRRAAELLTEVGLGYRLQFKPAELSGGEKQRVSIARAIAGDPKILLADEPTGNLDGATGRAVGELLRDLAKQRGAGVVVVTHDDRIRSIADRIVHLEDGKLRATDA